MISRISAEQVRSRFDDLLERIRTGGEEFIVEQAGQELCRIGPVQARPFTGADLVQLLKSLPPPDEEYLQAVEDVTRNQSPVPPSPWEP